MHIHIAVDIDPPLSPHDDGYPLFLEIGNLQNRVLELLIDVVRERKHISVMLRNGERAFPIRHRLKCQCPRRSKRGSNGDIGSILVAFMVFIFIEVEFGKILSVLVKVHAAYNQLAVIKSTQFLRDLLALPTPFLRHFIDIPLDIALQRRLEHVIALSLALSAVILQSDVHRPLLDLRH